MISSTKKPLTLKLITKPKMTSRSPKPLSLISPTATAAALMTPVQAAAIPSMDEIDDFNVSGDDDNDDEDSQQQQKEESDSDDYEMTDL